MKMYADTPVRRTSQILGDALLVVWILLWIQLATVVRNATLALAAPGRELESAGAGMAAGLRDAGASVDDLPLVGDSVRKPFDGAGDAAGQLADAGRAQVHAVESLAWWLAVAVALTPIIIALAIHLPLRIRFIRRATAGQRFLDSADDLDLFALRALSRQPLQVLARISPDPAGAWRNRDPETIARLAEVELRASGLSSRGVTGAG